MNWQLISFDWNQARAFLATAEEGSLSAAARALGLTQPTLSRQVAALEDDLGVLLFDRVGRSLSLTEAGLELLEHVRAMGAGASLLSLAASGRSQTIEGQVSITATDAMSAYILPAVLQRVRALAPGIEIEVVASNEVRDLRRREADIALRNIRPDQPDLIAKLARETTAHLYASTAYLDAHGRPQTPEDLKNADFVGFVDSQVLIPTLNGLGLPVTRRNFKLSSASSVVVWELVKQGLGITIMPWEIAALTPGIEKVLPELDPVPVPVWLISHRELLTSRRIRIVFDLLADALSSDMWQPVSVVPPIR
ncbi:MAG: LysR family transcriptional regulator [Pseudomonadota bacterium]